MSRICWFSFLILSLFVILFSSIFFVLSAIIIIWWWAHKNLGDDLNGKKRDYGQKTKPSTPGIIIVIIIINIIIVSTTKIKSHPESIKKSKNSRHKTERYETGVEYAPESIVIIIRISLLVLASGIFRSFGTITEKIYN